ncbi:kinase-like domain-containing protein [Fomes fomentarius]|nr:kinase-like domain-containing protein [Fomes fomentarius]
MFTSLEQKRLPRHAILSDDAVERYARITQKGAYNLLPTERFWQERQQHLQRHGYLLRPRYSLRWQPSWIGTNWDPTFCEDSIMSHEDGVIDARRIEDNSLIAIKCIRKSSQELHIAQFFTSLPDPQNHCVPVFDVFPDPLNSQWSLVAMPFLRPFNDPDFHYLGEIVDMMDQTLEGLAFMHSHRVAHRDISVPNIMMDAQPLYPEGYHPARPDHTPDALYKVTPLSRADHPVRYYYIDFGLSTCFSPGASSYVVGEIGRDTEVPELSDDIPYDAYKVDIFSLGNVYSKEFEQKYKDTEFLLPLIDKMKHETLSMRPSVEEVIIQWESIKKTAADKHRWRLSPKSEPQVERMINDTVDYAWQRLRKYVR